VVGTALAWLRIERNPTASDTVGSSTEVAPDLLKFHHNDLGNADRIKALHGASMRYSVQEKAWYQFDGQRWKRDSLLVVQKLAKMTMLVFLEQAIEARSPDSEKFAKSSMDQKRITAALTSLQCELPVEISLFDRHPHLLNFLNGTFDLRTGSLRDPDPADFITRVIPYNYTPDATCPRFEKFLAQIFGESPEASEGTLNQASDMSRYIQSALGYSLTGETSEKVVFVGCGKGDNGKTTLLATIRELVPEYSTTISLELLLSKEENNNTLAASAALLGMRFVTTSETEDGQRLNAARLKRITQGPGGVINACRKYENTISFPETHKLWIDANFAPELSATDDAAWNRLQLIPFEVTIPKAEQDHTLKTKLLVEAEGVLAWLVAGAVNWYRNGLQKPASVEIATKAWRDEMDKLGEFLGEFTERSDSPEHYIPNKTLIEKYREWCSENKYTPFSQVKFSTQLQRMGLKNEKVGKARRWLKIRFMS
jgi:putative DNA primase/helicase